MNKWITVLGVLLLGCSDPLDSVSLQFRADSLGPEELREWSVVRLESGHHRVTVRRAAEAAASCADLRGELLRTGRDLTLRIRDGAPGGGAGPASACGYTAVIDDVPSGRYHLRVLQDGPGSRAEARVVMDQPLNIR